MGRITGLVNNAGVVDVACRVEDMSWARLERMMRINVLGSFACAAQAVKRMSTRHGGAGGSIVNLSSAAALLVDCLAVQGCERIFTVPGDGVIDYPSVLSALQRAGYQGWLVVEAEQDPAVAPSYRYARMGYQCLRSIVERLDRPAVS
jgi:hypothetical protein